MVSLNIPVTSKGNVLRALSGEAMPEGDQIDYDSLELIQQQEDNQEAWVGFCRKNHEGKFKPVGSIKVKAMRDELPLVSDIVTRDLFFTVNGLNKPAPYKVSDTGLPDVWRREYNVRYLNVCYLDLDCYKRGMDWPTAIAEVLRAQEENIIPPASIVGRSGRGIYLMWLLHNEREGLYQRARPHEIALYKKINKAMIERLRAYQPNLNPDENATDASRVLRVPGSINSKADKPVKFVIQVGEDNQVPTYTLGWLAERFDVKEVSFSKLDQRYYPANLQEGKEIVNRGSQPQKRNGMIKKAEYWLQDLEAIQQHKGGFKQGKRRKSIQWFCRFAKQAGFQFGEIKDQAYEIAKRCKPPYPSDDSDDPLQKVVTEAVLVDNNIYWPRGDTLAKFFDVDDDLADELNLISIIPQATRDRREAEPSDRAKAKQIRQEAIREILEQRSGNKLSCRDLQKRLANQGIKTNHETVRKEQDAMAEQIQKALLQKPSDD